MKSLATFAYLFEEEVDNVGDDDVNDLFCHVKPSERTRR